MATNLAQFAFRNVVDNILVPAGVKVGGYPDDMFLDMDEDEQEKYQCNICYLIVKNCKECDNNHLFCEACIFAWTLTYGQNSDKCPVCRSPQRLYKDVKTVDRLLGDKKIKCPVEGCRFTGRLQIFLLHLHGREKYSNADVDFESLRNRHAGPTATGSLPPLSTSMTAPTQRLRQSRSMLHQLLFMFQWQLELRRRALQAQLHAFDPGENTTDRLDEALALQVQVDEIGSMMGAAMMSVPYSREAREQQAVAESSSSRRVTSTSLRQSGTSLFNPTQYGNSADASDEDGDSDSEASGVVSTERLRAIALRNQPAMRVLSSNGPSNTTTVAISEPSNRQRGDVPATSSSVESSQREFPSSVNISVSPSSSSSTTQTAARLPLLSRETMAAPRLQPGTTQTNTRPSVSGNTTATTSEPRGNRSDAQTNPAQLLDANEERLPQVARPNSVFRSRSRMDSIPVRDSAPRPAISINDTSVFRSQTFRSSPRSPNVNEESSIRSDSVNNIVSSSPERPCSVVTEEQTENDVTPERSREAVDNIYSNSGGGGGGRSDPVGASSHATQLRVRRRTSNRQGSQRTPQSQAGGRNRSLSREPSLSRSTTRLSTNDSTRAPTRQTDHSTRTPARQNNSSTDHSAENNGSQQRPRASLQRPSGASGTRESRGQTTTTQRTGSRPSGPTPRQIVRARRRSEIFQELMDQSRETQ